MPGPRQPFSVRPDPPSPAAVAEAVEVLLRWEIAEDCALIRLARSDPRYAKELDERAAVADYRALREAGRGCLEARRLVRERFHLSERTLQRLGCIG